MSTKRPSGRRYGVLVLVGAITVALSACGGGSGFDDGGDTAGTDGGSEGGSGSLDVLIASSGDAETQAVEEAVAAWSEESGTEASVNVAADLPQQLSQGFAAGSPPDVFYVSTDHFPGYAANGSLEPYADQLENVDDFYPELVNSFTFEDQLYCAPKDFSTLALIINDEAWSAAGLTEDDYPTTWEELAEVAATLTTDTQVGLSFGPEWQRIGVFMAQAGGGLVSEDGSEAVVDSPENAEALTFVKEQLTAGNVKYPSEVGTGWGGEAFGTAAAAMTIEGNWITGAMQNDFPDVGYTAVSLPEGPAGPGTLQFTNCWGIAADSQNKEAAVALVEHLTTTEQQLEFARAFGVMPSVQSAADSYLEEFPEMEAFLSGVDYAQGVPPIDGVAAVVSDFNAQLEGLAGAEPQAILTSVQSSMSAAVAEAS
ncbi:sugar ABC transporter substrate-binding protein [Georgenia subflava]|uniref:Extracellular solute-binding protein n=1 Tax=Georgenia subflava TaxID=1622177 RepID=A0A6N7EGP0_9MICO|nr:extracellular solute-binding protein [Georgenia subflava]MPV37299.1 extracellular solute-binding protein [Georgenia subflava]